MALLLVAAACGSDSSAEPVPGTTPAGAVDDEKTENTVSTDSAETETDTGDGGLADGSRVIDLAVGSCIDVDGLEAMNPNEPVVVVPCTEPHSHEIFHVVDHSEGEFDRIEIESQATDECVEAFEEYTGTEYSRSALKFILRLPNESQWDAGEHLSVCAAFGGDPLTESIKAPATTEAPQTDGSPGAEVSVAIPEVVAAEGGVGVRATLSQAPLPEGWVEEEFLFGGTATSYASTNDLTTDGVWDVEEADTAPFKTRMIVRRPPAAEFSGVVVVEWFNVTAGTDTSPDWGYLAEEMGRAGHVYIGVSVQEVGVNGVAESRLEGGLVDTRGLKAVDEERYGSLEHPGDAYAFDIMSQAGAVAAGMGDTDILDGLEPDTVIAAGESQSAIFLTTYVNAVHPVVNLFDGFLIHSRGSGAPAPSGDRATGADGVNIREDIGVPVFQYEAETDLTALGFFAARQPDSQWVHTWEVAGTAHADAYSLAVSIGTARNAELGSVIGCEVGVNDGPHHETLQAALAHLVAWVRDGVTPPASPLIEIDDSGAAPAVVRDDDGIALGGIRTAPVDVPLRVLSGDPSGEQGGFCFLFGQTIPLDDVASRYADVDTYMAAFDAANAEAVSNGWLLEADAATMREEELARAETLLGGS